MFAINNCSDEELKEMGLKARGDIIALRAFCKAPFASCSKQKLNELKMAVRQNNRVATPAPKSKEKTISLGWLHYCEKEKRFQYVPVRAKSGGGSRTVKVKDTMNKQELLEKLKNVFCPEVMTPFGSRSMLKFEVGKFDETIIEDKISIDGVLVDFTVRGFIKKFELSKARFYLLSKPLKSKKWNIFHGDDDGDDFQEWENDLPDIATLIPKKQKRSIENLSDNETQIQLENILETTLPGGLVNLSGEKSSFSSGQIQIYNENARDTDTIKTTETENDKSRQSRTTGLIGTTQDRAL